MKKRQIHPLLSILLALSLMFGLLAAPISAITESDVGPQAEGEIDDNMLTSFGMTLINTDYERTVFNTDDEIEVDLEDVKVVELVYGLTKPDALDITPGAKYYIDLPEFFEGSTFNQAIDIDGITVATYSIDNGQVIITFNDAVNDFDNIEMFVDLTGEFNTEVFEEEKEVVVNVPFREGEPYTATIIAEQQEYDGTDQKTAGKPYILNEDGSTTETDRNPTHVDWTVRVNDSAEKIEKATIVDELGDNLKIVEGSFVVERIIRNYNNKEIGRETIEVAPTITEKGFVLDLGNIDSAYDITYTTKLIRPEGGGNLEINNKATIILDETEKEDTDKVDVSWSGDLPTIEKSGNKTNDPHIIEWQVEYNYGKENLGTVTLSDVLTHGEILPKTVQVYEVNPNEDGKVIDFGEPTEGLFPLILDANEKAYYITFSSTVPVGLNDTVINTISDSLTPKNSDDASVEVNTIPTGGKVGEQGVGEDGRPYIEWTITMNTEKINVGSIEVTDVFNQTYLEFDVRNNSLYELKQDGKSTDKEFGLEYYKHDDGREGFTLTIPNAGPHKYEFVYRTYYTQEGMAHPSHANEAELIFKDGDGNGIGEGLTLKPPTLTGPKAGIDKSGKYIRTDDKTQQQIQWTVVFNNSKILLEAGSTLTEDFTSNNYEYIDSSLTLTAAEGETEPPYDLVVDDDKKGFVITLNEATKSTITVEFKTTTDDAIKNNAEHTNEAILKWQGGEEEANAEVGVRHPGLKKSGNVEVDENGVKTVNWTIDFNTNANIIHDFELTDTYTPAGVTVSNIVVSKNGISMKESEYTLDDSINGEFTIKIAKLDAVPYKLTYSTTLPPEEEQKEIKNTAAINYTGGDGSANHTIPSPSLVVKKEAIGIDKEHEGFDNPLISWKIQANTDSREGNDERNKYVNLVDAILEDTIPADQKLVKDSIRVYRADNITDEITGLTINTTDNSFSIELPDGPYQYTVTFNTEIMQMPSLDEGYFDKYNNATTLTNQSKAETHKQTDDADAWIRYYEGVDNDLTGKSGEQNEETENIDYTVTINPQGLTINNAKVTDTLSSNHQYVQSVDDEGNILSLQDSIVVKDAENKVLTDGYTITEVKDDSGRITGFTLVFAGGTISSPYTISYSTRLDAHLIGRNDVINNIVLTGGTSNTKLDSSETSTSIQQWFYGGGGSGRTVNFELGKIKATEAPLANVKFDLVRVDIKGNEHKIDAEILTNDAGIYVSGDIRAGHYILTETETPAGFETIAPIYFMIGYTHPDNYEEDEDGEVLNPHTVTITKNDWQASSHPNVTAEGNKLTVRNDFTPIKVNFEAIKALTGQDLTAGQFDFELLDGSGNVVAEASNDVNGDIKFNIELDLPGTHCFKIRELKGNQGGMKYDETVFNVTVVVSEGDEGLVAVVTYDTAGGKVPTFNNTYTATGSWTPVVSKKLAAGGRILLADEFNFKLTPVDGSPMPEDAKELLASNDVGGKVTFANIPYSEVNIGETYYYEIVEVAGKEKNMSYDPMTVTVKVVIADAGDGEINVDAKVEGSGDSEFNNSYVASGSYTAEVGKELSGRKLFDGEFNFRLIPVADATMPKDDDNKPLTELTAVNIDGRVVFDEIPYTEADIGKNYTYKITELRGTEGSITYDPLVVTLEVAITDGSNGELIVEAIYVPAEGSDEADTVFNNEYHSDGSWVPTFSKILDSGGRQLQDGEFNFELTPVGNAKMPMDVNNVPLKKLTAMNDAEGKVIFEAIPYTQDDAGATYRYMVVELAGDEKGMSYDPMKIFIDVAITDLLNGELDLEITIVEQEGQVADTEFNNTYVATGEWTPEVSKDLTAGMRELLANEFNFRLTPKGNATMPTGFNALHASNDAEGKVVFDTIPYTEADIGQTYYYEIVEVAGDEKGMTYDEMTVTYKVVITDDGDGVLNVETTVEGAGDTEFNNTYVASGEWTPEVSKVLTAGGRELRANEFNFKLTPVGDATMPEGADELLERNRLDGKVVFATIPYTEADINQTYFYDIVEVAGEEKGMSYDSMIVRVKVVITDAGGGVLNVVQTVEGETGDTEFNNIYNATGEWTPEVSKDLESGGRDLLANEFNFKLTPVGNATMPTGASELLASNDAEGRVVFATIPYTEADIGQTYHYEIVEVAGPETGMTYDQMTVTVRVKITDAGDGVLDVVTTVEGEEADSVFNNIYNASGVWTPEVSKKLAAGGRGLLANEFNFKLTPVGEATMPTGANELLASNDADGQVVFDTIPYTEADIGRTYYYEVVEVPGGEIGMTYDSMKVTYKVVITDAREGKLNVDATVVTAEGEAADTEFNNTYVASGFYTAEVGKELSGRELFDEEFNFRLIPVDGATMPVGEDNEPLAELTAVNIDGKVLFDTIPYTEDDIGQTHTYLITELAGTEGSITYDPLVITLEVAITDGRNGELIVDATYVPAEGAEEADTVFSNEYHADGSWVPTVSKQLLAGGRELQEDEFVFELYLLEADGETWTLLQTASNAADGGVVFEPVSYSELDVDQEYSYKIVERAATEAGMSYSDLEVTIQVSVTDPELLGELEVTTEYSEDRLFINTYEAEGSFAPELTKDLLGRDLAADEFSFTLVPVDGAPLPLDETGEPLNELTATNAADGKIVFADIAYTEADIGQTYTYLITELAGELGGVAYSEQEIVLTVNISDAGNGVVAISTLYTDDATFTNTYTVDPIEVVLEAEKQLKGQDLKAGQFEFELLDENGEVLETVKNAADGKVVFSAIEYNGAGEYNYVIREIKGSEPGYIYDESEYRVLVSVTDHGDGTITAEVEYLDGDVEFVNAYDDISAKIPGTGESRSILHSLGGFMVILGSALLIERGRRNRKRANS